MVSNAGGVNPQACVTALLEAARDQGVELSVATVTGDNFIDRVRAAHVAEEFVGGVFVCCVPDGGGSVNGSTGDDHWTVTATKCPQHECLSRVHMPHTITLC